MAALRWGQFAAMAGNVGAVSAEAAGAARRSGGHRAVFKRHRFFEQTIERRIGGSFRDGAVLERGGLRWSGRKWEESRTASKSAAPVARMAVFMVHPRLTTMKLRSGSGRITGVNWGEAEAKH
jgi:hypothetical protein